MLDVLTYCNFTQHCKEDIKNKSDSIKALYRVNREHFINFGLGLFALVWAEAKRKATYAMPLI